MQVSFTDQIEKDCVLATLVRLIDTINDRSITTGELHNLKLATICVQSIPIDNS